ncbi:MAG: helix-turn-helix domain-containing protein [Bacteroides sp.]|nr:helix-turn-helix domain-containing protein [Bacteroides sp.]
MARKKQISLTDEERWQLEVGYKYGSDHRDRLRCRAILLKSEHLSNAEVARKLDVVVPSVFNWTKRYSENGISGLKTRPGQGRKPIMDCSDEALVREAVSQERQSVKSAKSMWEKASGKKASDITFKRFLEILAQDISVSPDAQG